MSESVFHFKTKAYLYLVAFVILPCAFIVVRAERPSLKSYTTSDGLAHDRVNKIVRDSRGFLWFCTSEGLSRFDGYEFKNYTEDDGLPHRAVSDFLETRGGEFWVATNGGLVLFDPSGVSKRQSPKDDKYVAPMFRILRPADLKTEKNDWGVMDLLEDRAGHVWVATSSGMYAVEKQDDWQLRRLQTPAAKENRSESFTILLEDRSGAIWAGMSDGLARILPDKSGIEIIKKKMGVLSLLEDKNGRIWVGGSANNDKNLIGLHLFSYEETEPREIHVFRKSDGLSDDIWQNALLETSEGRIFVGMGNALCEYAPQVDPRQPQFRVVLDGGVNALAEDASGNVWFSTSSNGVRRLAQHGFVIYDKLDGLVNSSIASIISGSDGEVYILAEENKIHRFNGKNFDMIAPRGIIQKSWGAGQISFRDHTGAWWIAGAAGLQRYPSVRLFEDLANTAPLKIYTTKDGLFVNEVFRLFEDSRGDIWISVIGETSNTLLRWERATDRIHGYTAADGVFDKNAPTAFAEDSAGNIWIGFYSSGLVRYRNGKFEPYTLADNLPAGFIHNIFIDSKDRVWVASSVGGVARIDDPTRNEKPPLTILTTRDGLSSNQTICVTEDNFGRIYIGTGRGVNQLDSQTGRIKIFTEADGLPENIIARCKHDMSGTLWFGTANGLARYVPKAAEQVAPPPIFLSDVRVNGESIKKISELGETTVEDLDFAADQRQIQIDFFALGFSTGENLHYQYQIEGINAEWSEPSLLRTVSLNLSPGKYRFLVRAINSDGISSPRSAVVAFQIARPVWQRWWFLLGASILFGSAIYLLYRYRLLQTVKIERVRTGIATDLHDDLGANLSKIAILSEIVNHHVAPISKNPEVEKSLTEIAVTSREMIDSIADIVWVINPDRDRLSDLIGRMRMLATEMTELYDITLKIDLLDVENRDLSLGANVRREIYMIFKETLNNLVKHSYCDRVKIEFSMEANGFIFRVKDNGRGFDPNKTGNAPRGGNGLTNMRKRAENLGGMYRIESEVGLGTTSVLYVPLKQKFTFGTF